MREYNPIQYANKEDHPTMAMNNILACPWQPILGNEEPSVKTCFLAKLLEVLLQILHIQDFLKMFTFFFFKTSHYLLTTEENWSNQSINQCLFFETTSKFFSHNKFALNLMECRWLTWENLTCSRFFNERRSLMEHFKDKCTFLSW